MNIAYENRFFRWVWNFNALAIAIGSILVILVAGYLLFQQLRTRMADRVISDNVAVGDQTITKDIYTMGSFESVEGTNWGTMPLFRDQIRGASYYSKKSQENQMNTYFIDTDTGKGHWLLPDNRNLVTSTLWLTNFAGNKEEQKAIGALYTVVQTDSNGDDLLTVSDMKTIIYSNPDGNGVKTIIKNASKIISMTQTSVDRVIVVFENDKKNIVNVFNASDLTLASSAEIPIQ